MMAMPLDADHLPDEERERLRQLALAVLETEAAGDDPVNSTPIKRLNVQMKTRVANVKIDLQGLKEGQKKKIGKLIDRRMRDLETEIKDMIGEVGDMDENE